MITACKSPKCINNVDTEWTYCPFCGRNQTSGVQGGTSYFPIAESNNLPSAPKGEDSGVISVIGWPNKLDRAGGKIRMITEESESGVNDSVPELDTDRIANPNHAGSSPVAVSTFKPFRAWVAWHPVEGISDIALSRGSCEQRLTGAYRLKEESYEQFIAAHEVMLNMRLRTCWVLVEVEVKAVEK